MCRPLQYITQRKEVRVLQSDKKTLWMIKLLYTSCYSNSMHYCCMYSQPKGHIHTHPHMTSGVLHWVRAAFLSSSMSQNTVINSPWVYALQPN